MGRPKPAEPWRRPMKWDICLQFGSAVEFAVAGAGRFRSRSAPWRVPTCREKPGGREPHLAAAVSPQLPGAQGESATPGLGKRTKQVGGLGLGMPPSSPSAVSFLWFQAASAPAGIPRPTALPGAGPALPRLGTGQGAASGLILRSRQSCGWQRAVLSCRNSVL